MGEGGGLEGEFLFVLIRGWEGGGGSQSPVHRPSRKREEVGGECGGGRLLELKVV